MHHDRWEHRLSLHIVYYATLADTNTGGYKTQAGTPWMLPALSLKVNRAENMSYRLLTCL
jgi:hypothetical protein